MVLAIYEGKSYPQWFTTLFEKLLPESRKTRGGNNLIDIRRTGYMSSVYFHNEGRDHNIFFDYITYFNADCWCLKFIILFVGNFKYDKNNQIGKEFCFWQNSIVFLRRLLIVYRVVMKNKSSELTIIDWVGIQPNQFEMCEAHESCLSRWKQYCSSWKLCWMKTMYK